MRILVQRVSSASVEVENQIIGSIGNGLLLYLGLHEDDSIDQLATAAKKVLVLRIFEDDNNKMNRSLIDVLGELLIISQFTLHADLSKGTRPSFTQCMHPKKALVMYSKFIDICKKQLGDHKIFSGEFAAMMQVKSLNSGPATFIIELSSAARSKKEADFNSSILK